MADCIQTLAVCKSAGERQDFAFNLTDEFAVHWEENYPFQAGACVRPTDNPSTGFEYVSSGGVSGPDEPNWKKAAKVGATLVDGSLIWTAQAISNTSLKHRIASAEWTAADGLTLGDQVETDDPALQEVRIWATEGTMGTVYANSVLVTTASGAIFECRLQVTID